MLQYYLNIMLSGVHRSRPCYKCKCYKEVIYKRTLGKSRLQEDLLVCIRMLDTPEIISMKFRHCVFYGVESWSGVLEWSHRVESWRQMLARISQLKLKQSQSVFYNIARHFRCGCKFIYYNLDIFLGQPQT